MDAEKVEATLQDSQATLTDAEGILKARVRAYQAKDQEGGAALLPLKQELLGLQRELDRIGELDAPKKTLDDLRRGIKKELDEAKEGHAELLGEYQAALEELKEEITAQEVVVADAKADVKLLTRLKGLL